MKVLKILIYLILYVCMMFNNFMIVYYMKTVDVIEGNKILI